MRSTDISIVAALFLTSASAFGQQARGSHRWMPLFAQDNARVDLDTATVTLLDHERQVWLRWYWHIDLPLDAAVQYQLERRDIDCATGRTRVQATEYVDVGAAGQRKTRSDSVPCPTSSDGTPRRLRRTSASTASRLTRPSPRLATHFRFFYPTETTRSARRGTWFSACPAPADFS